MLRTVERGNPGSGCVFVVCSGNGYAAAEKRKRERKRMANGEMYMLCGGKIACVGMIRVGLSKYGGGWGII